MATEQTAPQKWPDVAELARDKGFDSLTELARLVPCHKSTLSRIAAKKRRPEGDLRFRLQVLLGIPVEVWSQLEVDRGVAA